MVAKALDANGAHAIYIIGRRKETLESAVQQAVNGSIRAIVGDVTSKDSLAAVVAQVKEEQGYINALFANSGIIGVDSNSLGLPKDRKPNVAEFAKAMWSASMEDFTQAMHVNVTGMFYTAVAFLELLDAGNAKGNVAQKSQIVVTASLAGLSRIPAAGYAYSASKAAAIHLTKMLATNLVEYKIRANVIAPGLYPSEMTGNQAFMMDKDKRPDQEGAVGKTMVPLERTGGEEDMAGAALYLASRAGGYLDGNIILTDGGRLSIMPANY